MTDENHSVIITKKTKKRVPVSSVFTLSNLVFVLAECFTLFLHTFWGCMAHVPSDYYSIPLTNGSTIVVSDSEHNFMSTGLMPAFQAGFAVWMFVVLWWKLYVAHFNPAVSIGLLVIGEFSPYLFIPYVIAQSVGGVIGASAAQMLRGDDIGPFIIPDDANIPVILCAEILLTGFLCFFIFMNVGEKSYDQQTGPLAIGMSVFQGTLAGRWVGAGILNPARAFGPAVVIGGKAWNYHWVWWVGDLLGGAVFGVFYRLFFAPPHKAWIYEFKKLKKLKRKNTTLSERGIMLESEA